MTNVLIPTIQDDIHAAAVALALSRAGHRAIRWFCSDLPQRCAASFAPGDGAGGLMPDIAIEDGCGPLPLQSVDVLWNRRVGEPVIGAALLPSDREVAAKESAIFVRGLLLTLSRAVAAINPFEAARSAENKLLQLQVARQVGLALPATLVSNDPARVRAFVGAQTAGAIFKSFKPVTWEAEDRVAVLFTAPVTVDALPADDILRLSPGIFQARLPKAFEVRVTCMGSELIAARLASQQTRDGRIDWRSASNEELAVSPMHLPQDIARRCHALLDSLGLVFGCIDLVVTPAGEWVFLEINQMGQFLWVEQACPEIRLLQTFCEFILGGDRHFRCRGAFPAIGYADVLDDAVACIERDRALHLQPAQPPHIVRE